MKIRLPFGYKPNIDVSVQLNPPPVYHLYVRKDGELSHVDQSTNREMLQQKAKALLQDRYGQTDTWDHENDHQLVHPKSPYAGTWGKVDTLISMHGNMGN